MINSNVFKFISISLFMCPLLAFAMEPRKDKKNIKNNSNQPKVVPPQAPSDQQQAIQTNNQKQVIPIEERVKHIYGLGDISDIHILRQELKKWGYDKEAWDRVNKIGAGPTPMMIAQKNKYHGTTILLFNYDRSDDPFFQAIMFGDKSKIDSILKKNPEKINQDIVIGDGCSCLPISWAISLEDEGLVEYFLSKGARIDIEGSIGLSPFDEASCSPKIRKLMAPYGGREFQRQEDFFKAVCEDDVEKMKELVARNTQSKFDIIKEPTGIFTPLKCAVFGSSMKAAQYLISNGAFINIPEVDSYKRDLFLHACMLKNIPMMHLLVKNSGIEFFLKDHNNSHCPFNYCLSDEVKCELFALYKERCNVATDQKLLSFTTKLGHKDLIQKALNVGTDINEYDPEEMTALLWACSYGNPDIIHFLIKHDADVNAVDKKERCGLRKLIRMHNASPKKYGRQLTTSELLPCLLLLVCYGANKDVEDEFDESPLDWVKKQKFNDTEKRLINRVIGADRLTRIGLKRLLNDIHCFQLKEFEQIQKKGDKQAICYIESSLVKREDKSGFAHFRCGGRFILKDMYEDCIINCMINSEIKNSERLSVPLITLNYKTFQEDVEKVVWFIAKQNENSCKDCHQLKIIHDWLWPNKQQKFVDQINKIIYIQEVLDKVRFQVSSLLSFPYSYGYEMIPGAHHLTWD